MFDTLNVLSTLIISGETMDTLIGSCSEGFNFLPDFQY